MFTKRCWLWLWLTSKSKASTSLSGGCYGSNPEQLRSLAAWLIEQEVEEVVMESTAQYWKPVWGALERYWKPMLPEARRCRPDVGNAPSGAGTIQSRAAGTQEGFSRCRTFGEAAGGTTS